MKGSNERRLVDKFIGSLTCALLLPNTGVCVVKSRWGYQRGKMSDVTRLRRKHKLKLTNSGFFITFARVNGP